MKASNAAAHRQIKHFFSFQLFENELKEEMLIGESLAAPPIIKRKLVFFYWRAEWAAAIKEINQSINQISFDWIDLIWFIWIALPPRAAFSFFLFLHQPSTTTNSIKSKKFDLFDWFGWLMNVDWRMKKEESSPLQRAASRKQIHSSIFNWWSECCFALRALCGASLAPFSN